MNSIFRIALLAGLVLTGACKPAPQQALNAVKVPAGFTFKMSRSVAVSLSSSAALLPAGAIGKLTLARPDGKLLFEGALSSAAQKSFRVGLPNHDQRLVATLTLKNGKTLHQELPVVGDTASYTFQ